jgi:hypothetical protein
MSEPLITNPSAAAQARAITREVQEDADPTPNGTALLKVRKLVTMADPDKAINEVVRTVSASWTEVDAKLVSYRNEGRGSRRTRLYESKHYPTLQEYMKAPQTRKRVLERFDAGTLRDLNDRIRAHIGGDRELREARATSRKAR